MSSKRNTQKLNLEKAYFFCIEVIENLSYSPHQYNDKYKNNQTTSTKCQYHALLQTQNLDYNFIIFYISFGPCQKTYIKQIEDKCRNHVFKVLFICLKTTVSILNVYLRYFLKFRLVCIKNLNVANANEYSLILDSANKAINYKSMVYINIYKLLDFCFKISSYSSYSAW